MNDLDRFGVNLPITEFGATIYPQGFRVVLDEVAAYGLPIVVTENGLADGFDTQRPRFLVDHLYAVAKAIDDGLDVRGYFHWEVGRRKRFGSFATAAANSSAVGGLSAQPFAFATSWRGFKTFATPPAAATIDFTVAASRPAFA